MSEKESQSDSGSRERGDDTIDETHSETAREQASDPGLPDASSDSDDPPSAGAPGRASPARPGAAPGRGLAWFALVLSVAALAGVAWLLVQSGARDDQGAATDALTAIQSDLAAIERRVSAAESVLADTERALEAVDPGAQDRVEIRGRVDRLQSELNERIDRLDSSVLAMAPTGELQPEAMARQIDALDQRFEALEAGQSELAARIVETNASLREQQGQQREVDRDLALKLDLLEASALLALGQARIELAGDRRAAVAAYEQASARLADADDSRLAQVRERLANELARIESTESPDWPSLGARLLQWEQQVGGWPLRLDDNAPAESEPQDEATEQGWLSGMRQSLGQLVTVERRDPLALDDELINTVREQARLNLAAAGLALERRDVEALQRRLSQVIALLDAYFQLEDEGLAGVRARMVEMSNLQPATAPEGLGQAAAALDRVIDSL